VELGQKLRVLRESKGLLLREVAAHLEIDTALISKIERGEKRCKRDHIPKLASILNADEKELTILWLAESIFPNLSGEEHALATLEHLKRRLKQ
jgi:HTH-type transcriptional regulator, competence development regulator